VPPGTIGFIAPELLAQQPYSYPADVYSLGPSSLRRTFTWPAPKPSRKVALCDVPLLLHDALRRPGSAKALLLASAGDFIAAVAHERPEHRPDCQELRTYKFFFEQCLPEAFRGVW